MAALPQQLGAEGVDSGDLGLVHQGRLAAQVGVSRAPGEPVGQFLHNTGAELGGGGLGVGDDQEAVHVQPIPLHPGQEALHQNAGLAGARRGRDQKRPAAVVHDGLLFRSQGKRHGNHLTKLVLDSPGGYIQ